MKQSKLNRNIRKFAPVVCMAIGAALAQAADPSGPMLTPLNAPLAKEKPAYLNVELSFDERVKDLVSRLTVEEKAMILNHKGTTPERIGLRSDQWNQCLNGVQWNRPTTLFPTCIAMGATWNPSLIKEVATALSDEARAIYNGWHVDPNMPGEHKGLIYRDPVINISRNPYWGRIHEVFSEDPYLTGRFAVAYVQGLHGDHPKYLKVGTTLKHFAVNNVEIDRQKLDTKVSERWLREYWLPHWRDAVVEGKATSLMASYNAINGTPNNINKWLLTDLLKNEWKHEGFVVSDLGGVRTMVEGHMGKQMTYEDAVAQSVMAGCDFSDKEYEKNIPLAVKSGKLTEERLNDALSRVLKVRFRLGEFDPQENQPWSKIPLSVIDGDAHRNLSLKVAHQSIVLLKNEKNTLPLDVGKLKRVAVIGPLADRIILNNYNGKVRDAITPLAGLRQKFGPNVQVSFAPGSQISTDNKPIKDAAVFDSKYELQQAIDLAKLSDVVVLCVGTDASIEQEGRDRATLLLPDSQIELIQSILRVNPRTILVNMSAGPVCLKDIHSDCPAIIQGWWNGGHTGTALADVLVGNINPGGRLPYTVYASDAQVPSNSEYDVSKGFTYMYVRGDPLWAFGHGLSYTTFKYSDLSLGSPTIDAGGSVQLNVTVTNTGVRDGDEVVQLYIRANTPNVIRASKQLVGFERIALKAGDKRTLTMHIPFEKLAFWDESTHSFQVSPGKYDILVGSASNDIRQTGTVEYLSK